MAGVEALVAHYLDNILDPSEPCDNGSGRNMYNTGTMYVYAMLDEQGQVIYIGVTGNESERLREHARSVWWKHVVYYRHWVLCCRRHALDVETRLLYIIQPPVNAPQRISAERFARLLPEYKVAP